MHLPSPCSQRQPAGRAGGGRCQRHPAPAGPVLGCLPAARHAAAVPGGRRQRRQPATGPDGEAGGHWRQIVHRSAHVLLWLLQTLTSQQNWGRVGLQALPGMLARASPELPPHVLTSQVLGDASCTSIHHSAAANWLLKVRGLIDPALLLGRAVAAAQLLVCQACSPASNSWHVLAPGFAMPSPPFRCTACWIDAMYIPLRCSRGPHAQLCPCHPMECRRHTRLLGSRAGASWMSAACTLQTQVCA